MHPAPLVMPRIETFSFDHEQNQNIEGSALEQYMRERTATILYPPEYKDGELRPFAQ